MNKKLNTQSSSREVMGSFAETERDLLIHTLAATPAQRLAWLEQALEFAYRAGVIPSKSE
jgi:hypothetical protein